MSPRSCRRWSAVCCCLLLFSIAIISWALLVAHPTIEYPSSTMGVDTMGAHDTGTAAEKSANKDNSAPTHVAPHEPARAGLGIAGGRPSMTNFMLMDKSACQWLVEQQRRNGTGHAAALDVAWHALQAGGRDMMAYCLSRCSLHKCCPHGLLRGALWLDVVKDDLRSKPNDVTLITQGTVDRVENVHLINHTWSGPKVVVFAIYNISEQTARAANAQRAAIVRAAAVWVNIKVLICILRQRTDFFTEHFASFKQPLLPINTLRNIGVDQAKTNYVFPLDIDFIPSKRLYDKLRRTYLPLAHAIDRVVMVVPHWETLRCHGSVSVPVTFGELDQQLRRGMARPFHVATAHLIPVDFGPVPDLGCVDDGSSVWTPGIKTTNYFRWYRESRDGHDGLFPLASGGGPTTDRYYEPFGIFRRVEADGRSVPRYQEQFVGRFKNKIAFISALRSHGYQFFAVRREFVVHIPHSVSNQTSPDMQGLLLMMRGLHAEERAALQQDVFLPSGTRHPGAPAAGPLDAGFACRNA